MKDIFTYLQQYSSTSFKSLPFNDVDALILIELSYLNLESVIKEDKEYPFHEVISLANRKTLIKDTFVPNLDERLIKSLAKAKRYQDLVFSHPLFKEEPEQLTQYFSFMLSEKGIRNYYLFRGTNKTVFGSIEDLTFATKKGPESLKIAIDYLNPLIKESDCENYLIGHSKGGTIVEEAYLGLDKENKSKINRIYDFDGPGVWYPAEGEDLEDLASKTRKFVTKRTIFGLLLKNPHDYTLIDGKNRWLLHHMVFSWRIDGTEIGRAKKVSAKSLRRRDRMNQFVSKLTDEDITKIIDSGTYLMTESRLFRIKDFAITRIIKFIKVFHYARTHHLLSPNFKEFLFVCKDTFL